MLIKKIVLVNFRQFYGEQKINFSTNEDKNVTLIHAENGVGKTALLNAILWCFFKTFTSNFKDPGTLLNNAAEAEGKQNYKVEIEFEEEGINYSVQRSYGPVTQDTFRIFIIEAGDFKDVPNPDIFINSVIPKDMANYFFFQGEGVGSFTSKHGGKQIKEAIQKILGFTVAKNALEDVKKIKKEYSKALQRADKDGEISKIQRDIDQLESDLQVDNKRLEEKNESVKRYAFEIQKIDAQLASSNSEFIKEKYKERAEAERDLKDALNSLSRFENNRVNLIKKYATNVFAHGISFEVLDFIDEDEFKTNIPSPYNENLVYKILEETQCICGADISVGSEAYNRIQDLLKSAADPQQESRVTKAQAELRSIKKISSLAKEDFEFNLKGVTSSRDNVRKFEERLKNISIEIQGTKDIGDIHDFEKRRSQFQNRLGDDNRSIGNLERKVKENASLLEKKRGEILRLKSSSSEVNKYRELEDIAQKIQSTIESTLVSTQKNVELNIIGKVNSFLRKFVRQDYHAKMDKDSFDIRLFDRNDQKVAESDGQGLLLSLTFISSLISLARDRKNASGEILTPGAIAPFIIDAPFGVLDNKYKGNVAKSIPQSVGQVVFFLSSSHWEGTVEDNIRDRVGIEYNLVLEVEADRDSKDEDVITIQGKKYPTVKYNCSVDRTVIEKVGTYV
ncbi:MAG: AAA family ATPase [Neptunomonas phycophila]|uniref:AAA family ATPase n=1 Tax=Neptunomonas phycophila TaxID=1572645 RepID=UPI003B8D6882